MVEHDDMYGNNTHQSQHGRLLADLVEPHEVSPARAIRRRGWTSAWVDPGQGVNQGRLAAVRVAYKVHTENEVVQVRG